MARPHAPWTTRFISQRLRVRLPPDHTHASQLPPDHTHASQLPTDHTHTSQSKYERIRARMLRAVWLHQLRGRPRTRPVDTDHMATDWPPFSLRIAKLSTVRLLIARLNCQLRRIHSLKVMSKCASAASNAYAAKSST